MRLHFLIIALFSNGVACVNSHWKAQPEDVVVFSSGVSLYLKVDSVATVVFDEGELDNYLISDCITKYNLQSSSSPHKKVLAASKP